MRELRVLRVLLDWAKDELGCDLKHNPARELKVRGAEYYGSLIGNLLVNRDDKNYIVELINENFSETIINNNLNDFSQKA